MTMSYNFTHFNERADEVKEWLKKELAQIRTGRATPTILDSIHVESYGAKSPLSHVASISIEDAKTLRVTPWDKTLVADIEKAITVADIGVSVSSDGAGLRVAFPELTAESRGVLAKLIKEKLEHSRVSLRAEREKVMDDLKAKEKDGEITEDEKFNFKEDLQKLVDKANHELEEAAKKKEDDIKG